MTDSLGSRLKVQAHRLAAMQIPKAAAQCGSRLHDSLADFQGSRLMVAQTPQAAC